MYTKVWVGPPGTLFALGRHMPVQRTVIRKYLVLGRRGGNIQKLGPGYIRGYCGQIDSQYKYRHKTNS